MGEIVASPRFFHVYQDTPRGREALQQTAFFCRIMGAAPVVYIPESSRFLMYFENRVVQVDLEGGHWGKRERERAQSRAAEILADAGLDARFLEVRHRTTPALPDIPVDFDYMACPVPLHTDSWVYSDLGMRRLPAVAPFFVLMPAPVARPWKSLLLCYGGSEGASRALKIALGLAETMGLPLDVFGLGNPEELAASLEKTAGSGMSAIRHCLWRQETGENPWMGIPPDALLVLGASGKSWIREALLPSFKKKIRCWLSFPMLFVGSEGAATFLEDFTSLRG